MLKNERQSQIFSILRDNSAVTVKALSEMLYISESSIRRDLADMENKGLLKRRYGGAEIISSYTSVLPFSTRSYDNTAQKHIIAGKAVKLIKTGDIVFLDQSSTAYFLAQEIRNLKSITVITNNLEILNILADCDITVLSSGGIISRANCNCLIGHNAQRTFEEIYADIAFFSAKSLSIDGTVSDCTQEEIFVRNAMLAQADKKVFMCDSSKFHTHSAYKQCTLADIDILVTENEAAQKFKAQFPKLQIL